MKNLLKYSAVAGAAIALAGSAFAVPTLVITDGTAGLDSVTVVPTGFGTFSVSGDGWTVVGTIEHSSPPFPTPGTAQFPAMDVSIDATYSGNGTTGSPLNIYWGSDGFGPSSASFVADITGHMVSGPGGTVQYNTYYNAASGLPSGVSPFLPAGSTHMTSSGPMVGPPYNSIKTAGPFTLPSYSLIEDVTIAPAAGTEEYSLDASLTAVPDGGMTLVLLGSALSGLALLKKKLF